MPGVETVDLAGAGGVRLRADAFGDPDDPPVLLLHGGGQTRFAWGSTPQALADRGWRVYRVDMRGHGESEWPDDGDYSLWAFADDTRALAASMPSLPVLVGASLGGLSSMVAIGESDEPVARGLVLVDVAPTMEDQGKERIGEFMRANAITGFASLDEVADAIAAYNPHRPRPTDLSGLQKNVRLRDDGRWYWHWDPRFMTQSPDETRSSFASSDRLKDAARSLDDPDAARARPGERPAERGRCAGAARSWCRTRSTRTSPAPATWWPATATICFNDAIVGFLDRLK